MYMDQAAYSLVSIIISIILLIVVRVLGMKKVLNSDTTQTMTIVSVVLFFISILSFLHSFMTI